MEFEKGRLHLKPKKKSGLINKQRFFRLISANSNHLDPEVVELVYLGLVKTVSQELRANGFIRLPWLADVALKVYPPHFRPVNGRSGPVKKMWYEDLVVVKFYTALNLSKYFNKFGRGIKGVER